MAWLYLLVAGLMEVAWAVGLKYTRGFTQLWPSVITIAAILLLRWIPLEPVLFGREIFLLAVAVEKPPDAVAVLGKAPESGRALDLLKELIAFDFIRVQPI